MYMSTVHVHVCTVRYVRYFPGNVPGTVRACIIGFVLLYPGIAIGRHYHYSIVSTPYFVFASCFMLHELSTFPVGFLKSFLTRTLQNNVRSPSATLRQALTTLAPVADALRQETLAFLGTGPHAARAEIHPQ
jgi:hypothetical protein